jgi:photosystem II stability/assembly factor-like uncharacterized protein
MEKAMSTGFGGKYREQGKAVRGKMLQAIFRAESFQKVLALGLLLLLFMSAGCNNSDGKPAPHAAGVQSPGITLFDRFYDIAAVDKNIWIVGYFGKIVYSPDGGATWSVQASGTTSALMGVSFVNENIGWVVGEGGLLLHTGDGGVTWRRQETGISKEVLLKVLFLNEKNGYAVGNLGVILHTSDGGSKWERIASFQEDVTLNDLCFINESEGWIAGEFETILHTEDGGNSWQTQRSAQEGKLFGISFTNTLNGIAVGAGGRILITADGGKNWREGISPTEDTLLKVQMEGSEALAIGLRGAVVGSGDKGQTWSFITIPEHYSWLSGMAFTKGNPRYLVVGDEGKILKSTDGKNWARIGLGAFAGGLPL